MVYFSYFKKKQQIQNFKDKIKNSRSRRSVSCQVNDFSSLLSEENQLLKFNFVKLSLT